MHRWFALMLAVSFGGCADDHSHDTSDPEPLAREVAVRFAAEVLGEPFSCAMTYEGLGTTGTRYTPLDLRFYVHGVTLIDAAGEETPVTLAQDGVWQYQDLALLDFEDRSGACANGTTQTNAVVTGSVPDGDYVGLRYTVGVPFALNHIQDEASPSPLNLSAMFWNWQGGYKFMRIDGQTDGLPTGALFHLGSTGCTTDADGAVDGCANPNRATFTFDTFDLDNDEIVLDLAALFDGVNLDENTPDTPAGCMAAPTDPECEPIFASLGLPFGASAGGDPGPVFVAR